MTNRIDNVTIVGGGTAGWLSAIMLLTFMNARRDGPPIGVTLIESPRIPTIGVGEATVPGMARLLRQLDIDEAGRSTTTAGRATSSIRSTPGARSGAATTRRIISTGSPRPTARPTWSTGWCPTPR